MTEQPTSDATETVAAEDTNAAAPTEETNPVDAGPSVVVEQNDGITTTSTIPQDAAPVADEQDPDYTETEGTKDTAP